MHCAAVELITRFSTTTTGSPKSHSGQCCRSPFLPPSLSLSRAYARAHHLPPHHNFKDSRASVTSSRRRLRLRTTHCSALLKTRSHSVNAALASRIYQAGFEMVLRGRLCCSVSIFDAEFEFELASVGVWLQQSSNSNFD